MSQISSSGKHIARYATQLVHGRGLICSVRSLHLTSRKQDIFNIQDTDDFEERVVKSDKPVIIDFHAKWCGPCKQLTPRLVSAVEQFTDQVHLATVDIDEHDELATKYQVSAVPVVFAVKNGRVADKFIGLQDADRIVSFIRGVINK